MGKEFYELEIPKDAVCVNCGYRVGVHEATTGRCPFGENMNVWADTLFGYGPRQATAEEMYENLRKS